MDINRFTEKSREALTTAQGLAIRYQRGVFGSTAAIAQ